MMKTKILPALLGTCALVLAACGGDTTGTQDTPQGSGNGSTETAAGGEGGSAESGEVTLYTSEPQEKIDELIAAFNEEYPDITVDVFRAGTGDLTTRIETERTTGDVQADVLLAADAPTFENYKTEDLLLPLDAQTDGLLDEVVDPEGYYIGTRVIPTVIAYNTTIIDTPPASWQDLASPDYADQIIMPNPDVSGAAAFNAAVWLLNPDLGEQWLTALAANNPVIADANGPVAQGVAAGTQPLGVVVDYLVRDLSDQGSPIAVSYPSEGVPYVYQPIGIFSATDNEDAAQTFVQWVIDTPAQEIAVEQNYLPVRTDVDSPQGAPSMDELTLLEFDLEEVNNTRSDAVSLFNSLFQ